jgi:hypothetical protein
VIAIDIDPMAPPRGGGGVDLVEVHNLDVEWFKCT